MPQGRLYIGNRRYSSWSLRGWLAVKLAGLEVEEVVIPLAGGETPAVKAVSPSGRVPYLEYGGHRIWETLAIIEYCAELAPGRLWPGDQAARIHARVIAAEMHGGFRELRIAMPMNLGRDFGGLGRTPGALADIARIEALWAETRARFGGGGPFLFGRQPNAADAMFAPVVARFLSYRPELTEASQAYCKAIRLHPLVVAWYEGAMAEPAAWLVAKYENP